MINNQKLTNIFTNSNHFFSVNNLKAILKILNKNLKLYYLTSPSLSG